MNIIFIILAIIAFISLYGVTNYYIGLRTWQNLGIHIPLINNKIYWIVFWIVAISYIIAMLLPAFIPSIILDFFQVIGGYWLVIMLYAILLLPIIDIIRVLNKKFSFLPHAITKNEKTSLIVALTVLVLIIGVLAYGSWSARSIKVNTYDLSVDKNGGKLKSLKVIMVSDIHLGVIMDNKRLTSMVNKINELDADVILLAGDIIDSKIEPFINQNMGENFKRLNSKYGVYACLGNHESIAGNIDNVVKEYEKAGITVLRDESELINDSFYVIGRIDSSEERRGKIKRKGLADIISDGNKEKPMLLLDHQPKNLQEPKEEGIDLQVSGHTHRGQIAPANFITGRIFEIDYGYLKKDNFNIIVSSGFGTWGPPVRIGSRSEIVEINLSFK